LKVLKIAVQIVWTMTIVGGAIAVGAIYGWQQSGTFGSIALGIVGFVAGALAAASPALLLQFMR
jgi:hypothetical protein